MEDVKKIKILVEDFNKLWQVERGTRKSLDAIATKIKYTTSEVESLDRKVTNGTVYVSELRDVQKTLNDLKAERDKISDRLEREAEATEKKRGELRPEISRILYERYRAHEAQEKLLLDSASIIQEISDVVSSQPGLQYSMKLKSSQLCSGQAITISDRDTALFNEMKGDLNNGSRN